MENQEDDQNLRRRDRKGSCSSKNDTGFMIRNAPTSSLQALALYYRFFRPSDDILLHALFTRQQPLTICFPS